MPLNLLLAWWNLVYIVPFALALIYLGLFVFTGITFGDADADVDADADADVDACTTVHVEAHVADIDADADADLDSDASGAPVTALAHSPVPSGAAMMAHLHTETAGHADSDGDADGHAFFSLLSLLGVGKIPLSLALMVLLFSWGVVGFALNTVLTQWLGGTALVSLVSLPATFMISLALTGLCAAAIAKIIPSDEGTRERRQDLVGRSGEAIYDINATFGMASVRGTAGDFFQVPCRTAAGKPTITKGTRVVLFDYDREQGVFQAAPFEA